MRNIALMDATNTNRIPECYRDFYMESGTKKLINWAHLFESKHLNKSKSARGKLNDSKIQRQRSSANNTINNNRNKSEMRISSLKFNRFNDNDNDYDYENESDNKNIIKSRFQLSKT